MIKTKCVTCSKEFQTYNSWIKLGRKHCSWKCRNQNGLNNPQWVGNKIGYKGIHKWLNKNFGKVNKCQNIECNGDSDFFEWALKTGKMHEWKRENYLKLCRSCHKKYDMTNEMREIYKKCSERRIRNKFGQFI